MKTFQLILTEEQHRKLKTLAAQAGMSMKGFILKLVEKFIQDGAK